MGGGGAQARIATDLGLRPRSVHTQLHELRKRLGVDSTGEATTWLDEHRPGWRDEP
ncbi:MAG: hypothetical protein ACP5VP_11355 [Candidatus Limnocylindrales bacterium]